MSMGYGSDGRWDGGRRRPSLQRQRLGSIVTLPTDGAGRYGRAVLHLYLDESGDHSLRHIQPSYPLFVLGGVILADDDAVAAAVAAVAAFKRRWFGAARVVLHTADLVRNRGAFVGLKDVALRGRFFDDLNELLQSLEFSVVACAVRKDAHLERYGNEAIDPYLLALTVLVERFCFCVHSDSERGRIIAERRTAQLDRQVEMGWGYLRTRGTRYVRPSLIARRIEAFDFVGKSDAPAGMELADMVVSPLGRMLLGKRTRIDQSIVQAKLRRGPDGREWGRGLIVLPHE